MGRRLVGDEVWRQLDPYTGQLAGSTVRRLRLAVALAAALTLAVGVVGWSGLVLPRVAWGNQAGGGWSTDTRRVEFETQLVNRGWSSVEVLGFGRSGPGLQLLEARGAPASLAPGQAMRVTLVYRVTDCAAVTADPWPVPVRMKRPWGVYTGHVELPTQTSRAAPTGLRSYTGRDPYAVEWQRALADGACAAP